MLGQQLGDALGVDRGLVVRAARAHRPGPQGAALAVADHGGLEGVLLALAGDERVAGRVGGRRAGGKASRRCVTTPELGEGRRGTYSAGGGMLPGDER
jgi:hypothetical protein